jgi:DNA-binding beta-propeller fold protein YncE
MTHRGTRLASLAVLVAGIVPLAAPANSVGADRIFWTNFDGAKVSFANLDGSGSGGDLNTTGATAPNQPAGIAIDPVGGRVYWANAGSGKISFANLDGSGGGGDLNTSGATTSGLRGLAIDVAGGRIYWASTIGGTISYANLNGTGGGNLSTSGATIANPNGIAIDPATNRIYWANRNTTTGNKISYANLDGTGGGADLTTTGATVSGPTGVALDAAAGRIYWTNAVISTNSQKLSAINLNGTGGGDLNTTGACTACNPPSGVALDPSANRIYWTNSFTVAISFANLDGSGSGGDLGTSGGTTSGPTYLAILRAPVASGLPEITGGNETPTQLSCSTGEWAPNLLGAQLYRSPASFSYQWTLDGSALAGATSDTITATDPGDYRCEVTASNNAGSAGPEVSDAHQVSSPPPVPPSLNPPAGGPGPAATAPARKKCKRKKSRAAVAKKKCKKRKR